jgi:hypothetical protein
VSRLIEPKASDVGHFGATTAARPFAFGPREVRRVALKDIHEEGLEPSQQVAEHVRVDIITPITWRGSQAPR